MRTLLAAITILTLGCGPEDPVSADPGPGTATVTAPLDGVAPEPEETLRLVIVPTEQGLLFKLVNDPVEDRFFYDANVTQPAPQVPTPPCPNCR